MPDDTKPTADRPTPREPTCAELDDLFELLIDAAQRGVPFDLEGWLHAREHLRSEAERLVRLAAGVTTRDDTARPSPPGFTIIGEIGRGGMGVVYRALQHNPKRTVALKVTRATLTSPNARKRFELETELLARLEHPGIARIYGAGVDPDTEEPFFSMEFVEGKPLDQHAAEHSLSTRQRLDLIAQICDATEHAHQKGVVHRDLKPSNILVIEGSTGADGRIKILDFGVARATDSDLTITTLHTDVGALIGTLPYMSPEQAGGNPNDIDTRSDVYALGVVAYKLLTGRLPYDLDRKLVHEAVRIIREQDPTPLSSTNRTLRGDIEIIVAKALEKDKPRRYQSASALADDIRRYLHDQPINARPPSAAYQLRKFARRHRALVTGVAATFLVLLAGIGATSWQAVAATRARDQARTNLALAERSTAELEQVAQFQSTQLAGLEPEIIGADMREDLLLEVRSALAQRGGSEHSISTALDVLDRSMAGANFTNLALSTFDRSVFRRTRSAIDEQFADQPLLRARLFQTLANTLDDLGLHAQALEIQRDILDIQRRAFGDEHPDTLTSRASMAHLLAETGDRDAADPIIRDVLDVRTRVLGKDHPDTLRCTAKLADLCRLRGNFQEAESLSQIALDRRRAVLGEDHPDTLTSYANHAVLLDDMGRLEEAAPFARAALEGRRRALGERHPDTLVSMNNVGFLLCTLGRYDEAEPFLRGALEAKRSVFGDDHPSTVMSIGNLAILLSDMGRLDEAESLYRERLERAQRALGELHPSTLSAHNNLAILLKDADRIDEALEHFRKSLEGRRIVYGDDHPDTLNAVGGMGLILMDFERYDEAEALTREAADGFRRIFGPDHPKALAYIGNLGTLFHKKKRFDEAVSIYRDLLASRERTLGPDHIDTLAAMANFGNCLRSAGKPDEADPILNEAIDRTRTAFGDDHWYLGVFLGYHARTLTDLQRFPEAEARYLEAYNNLNAALGPDHTRTRATITFLAESFDAWHKAEPDAGHDAQAAEWRAKLPPEEPAQDK